MPVLIRLAVLDDAAQIAAIYAPYVIDMATSFELIPPDASEIRLRIKTRLDKLPWLIYEQDGEVIGYAYASQFHERAAYRWSAEVTAYIHKDYHRRGIGRALYTTLFKILEVQGYVNLIAGITLPNASSVGLHEAMGFEQIATYRSIGYKFEKWHDVGYWQLVLQPYDNHPREPIPIAALAKSEH